MTAESRNDAPEGKGGAGKRMVVFYAKDAKEPKPERMPREGIDDSVMSAFAKLAEMNFREGIGEKNLLLFSEPGDNGFSLLYAWFKSGYILPRHSHSADCLYYVLGGELRMGSHVLRKGDGMFIPSGHGYGYEAGPDGVEVLEFRNATRFNLLFHPNDRERWDRVVENFRDRAPIWMAETVPPSDR